MCIWKEQLRALSMAQRRAYLVFMCGLIAVMYQVEMKIDYWNSSHYTSVETNQDELFRFIMNTDRVEKWFMWVSYFRSADQRPLGINKKYEAVYKLPLFGEYAMMFNTVEFTPKERIVLESEEFFKPRVEIQLRQNRPRETRMALSISYNRSSVLFNIFVQPILSLLTSQQIQHSLFLIRMFFPN